MAKKAQTAAAVGIGTALLVAAEAARRRRRAVAPTGEPRPPLAGPRSKVETSDGAVIQVQVDGPAGGPTVVLPHCWTGSPAIWEEVAAALVDQGHRVVRYEQRGHGGSTIGAEGVTIARLGTDLRDVLVAVDGRDAVIAGHSLGGMATQSFAIEHRDVLAERVRALVLVATASAGLDSPLARAGLRVVGAPAVGRLLSRRGGHRFVRGALGRGATAAAITLTRDTFVATPPSVRVDVLRAMLAMDLRRGLDSISVPTTVVVGSRDTLTPPSHGQGLAASIPGARLVEVPGAGHMLPLEAPQLLFDLIGGAHS